MRKTVLLIGLGRFGRHVARKLHELNHEILAVDKDEEFVNMSLSYVTNALVADSTDQHFLESLGIRNFDLCIVAIGDDFQSSLETTSLLKELGANYVVSRASRGIHEKFLLRNGADEVVYPEKQLAQWTAIRFGFDHILDYFQLSDRYAVYELPMPEAWVGHTIGELKVRQNYGVNILGIRQDGNLTVEFTPQMHLQGADTILVVGKREDVQKYFQI
ncbi:MAG: TrkA family potassium uptake protein [Selenomonas sp.]|nr:TrkA family potassium uptake protein [Selenomonas sp.]